MIKQITFDDIKFYLRYNKNPYEILGAGSTSNYISVYINKTQRITVFPKGDNVYEYEFQEKINEDEETVWNTNTESFKNDLVYYLFFCSFSIPSAIYVFILLSYTSISSKLAFIISCLLVIILSCIIFLAVEFKVSCMIADKHFNFEVKSNHSAEHMVINFIKKNHQIPKSLEELRFASRFEKNCSSRQYISQNMLSRIANFFVISVLFIILIYLNLPIIFKIFIFLLFVFIKEKICRPIIKSLSTLGSYIIQYKVSTTKNVSDESLITAFIAASIWFHITHYNEYDENTCYTFLKSANVTDVHECDTNDQPL